MTLNASLAPDSSGTPGAHSLYSANTRGLSSADALAKLMGKALVTSPGKSPNRRLSQKKAPSRGKAPSKAFASPPSSPPRAATSPSGKSEEAEIVPPPPGYRPPPRIPASTLGRTFNPTYAQSAQHPMLSRCPSPLSLSGPFSTPMQLSRPTPICLCHRMMMMRQSRPASTERVSSNCR